MQLIKIFLFSYEILSLDQQYSYEILGTVVHTCNAWPGKGKTRGSLELASQSMESGKFRIRVSKIMRKKGENWCWLLTPILVCVHAHTYTPTYIHTYTHMHANAYRCKKTSKTRLVNDTSQYLILFSYMSKTENGSPIKIKCMTSLMCLKSYKNDWRDFSTVNSADCSYRTLRVSPSTNMGCFNSI